MSDWDDTVTDRANGKLAGFIGDDEPVADAAGTPIATTGPIEDVRRDAIEATEAAGVDVVDVPQPPAAGADASPSSTSSDSRVAELERQLEEANQRADSAEDTLRSQTEPTV